jgi:hypothetical protein
MTYHMYSLVEREAFVQAFSPGTTLEPGLKTFCRRGPKCHECSPTLVPVDNTTRKKDPPLVSVRVTNRDKRVTPFSLGS